MVSTTATAISATCSAITKHIAHRGRSGTQPIRGSARTAQAGPSSPAARPALGTYRREKARFEQPRGANLECRTV
jgi:hypothetical protein